MTVAEQILAILGLTSATYGFVLLGAWSISSLSPLKILAPFSWRRGDFLSTKRLRLTQAGYLTVFGLFVGCDAFHQNVLAILFAIPSLILAVMVIERLLGSSKPPSDA
jgi:hypothetical protein